MPDNPRPMGRPTLGVKATTVRLTDDDRRRIVALVGKQRMSDYIREATRERLAHDEEQKAREPAAIDARAAGDWLWLVGADQDGD